LEVSFQLLFCDSTYDSQSNDAWSSIAPPSDLRFSTSPDSLLARKEVKDFDRREVLLSGLLTKALFWLLKLLTTTDDKDFELPQPRSSASGWQCQCGFEALPPKFLLWQLHVPPPNRTASPDDIGA
jgi:hypothetical protein